FILASPKGDDKKSAGFKPCRRHLTTPQPQSLMPVPYTVPARTTERIEILKKLPPDQLGDPHAAVYPLSSSTTATSSKPPTSASPSRAPAALLLRKSNCSKRTPRAGGARPR